MKWCKERAQDYIDQGQYEEAITSFMSDIGTEPCMDESIIATAKLTGMLNIMSGFLTKEKAQKYLDGFSDYKGDGTNE